MNISTNRKAKFDYQILEEFSAGIVLLGSEVKSVRLGHITLNDSFIYLKDGEVWIKNLRISRYHNSHKLENHDETREKKLLLTKKQINQISKEISTSGISCIPISVYILKNRIKVNIAIVKGKKNWDKRQTIKERDIKRELQRNGH